MERRLVLTGISQHHKGDVILLFRREGPRGRYRLFKKVRHGLSIAQTGQEIPLFAYTPTGRPTIATSSLSLPNMRLATRRASSMETASIRALRSSR